MKKLAMIVALLVSASISAIADDIVNRINDVAVSSSNPNVATPMEAPTSPEAINLHPAFFNGEVYLGNGVYYLQFPNGTPFGLYVYLSDPHFIYHFDLGYEYVIDANDAYHGIYAYDFATGAFCYTTPSIFPFFYDFSLNAWLYYLPGSHNPRWFFNLATGQWFPS